MKQHYFLEMLHRLRRQEEVMLYGHMLSINSEEEEKVLIFLEEEYNSESLDFPYSSPDFNHDAALWAAKQVYHVAQLVLYRKTGIENVQTFIYQYPMQMDASVVLSADLCLRFLPHLIDQLKIIDPDDDLLSILDQIILLWPYSALRKFEASAASDCDLSVILANNCAKQLFVDRVLELKQFQWAQHPEIAKMIKANVGIYGPQLLKNKQLEHLYQ